MAKQHDRKLRKQNKRAAKDVEKAQRRGDALVLLEAKGALPEPGAVLELFVRDVEASLRRGDEPRVIQLARASLARPELLAVLGQAPPVQVASCGWILVGAALRSSQWELGERLLAVFEGSLAAQAPELLAWLRAYIDQHGEILQPQLEQLVALPSSGPARRMPRMTTLEPHQLEAALLAAADQVGELESRMQGLAKVEPVARRSLHALALRLAWRLALTAVRMQSSPRQPLGLVAELATADDTIVLLGAIRLAHQHQAELRTLASLLVVAFSSADLRPAVLAVLKATPITCDPDARRAALELGRRLLAIPSEPQTEAEIWQWSVHRFNADPSAPPNQFSDEDEPPRLEPLPDWLRERGLALVRGGSFVRQLEHREPRTLANLLDAIHSLPWQAGLTFVEQAVARAERPAEDRRALAMFAGECLQQFEPREHARGVIKVKDLLSRLERILVRNPHFDPDALELRSELRSMPPDLVMAGDMVDEVDQFEVSHGPIQRAFIERHAAWLLPYDFSLLHDLLDETLRDVQTDGSGLRRALELVDLHFGDQPALDAFVDVIALAANHGWETIERYALERMLVHFAEDALRLANAFAMLDDERMPTSLLKSVARALCDVVARGATTRGIPPDLLRHVEKLAGKRKPAAAKKKPAAAKKKPAAAKKKPAAAKKKPAAAKKKPAVAKQKPVDPQLTLPEGDA